MPQKVPVLPFSMSAAVTLFPESCWAPVGFSTPAPLELLLVSVPGQRRCSLALRPRLQNPGGNERRPTTMNGVPRWGKLWGAVC